MSPAAKAAARAIGEFVASLVSLAYGLALIALCMFGVWAAVQLVIFGALPPAMADNNEALQVFVLIGASWALLEHWIRPRA